MTRHHRQQYLKTNQVSCIVCFHVFDSQQELDDHCDEKHSKSKCNVCKRQFQHAGVLKQHMERHKVHPFNCKLCDHGFSSLRMLSQHCSKMHPKDKVDVDESNSPANSLQFYQDENSVDLDSVDLFQK